MFSFLVDEISTGPENQPEVETGEAQLAASIEELASLRFTITLTARFADSPSEDPERREQLRERLATLRRQYENKVDSIAMTLGVQAAMTAKDEVERKVTVPRGLGI